jgi:hypothetical protein
MKPKFTIIQNKTGLCFRKSSFSDTGKSCVGVHIAEGEILVINTNKPNVPMLRFTFAEWDAFIKGVKNNEFDIG